MEGYNVVIGQILTIEHSLT